MMALYAEAAGGHVAKRPRVEYQTHHITAAVPIHLAASTGAVAAAANAQQQQPSAVTAAGILSQQYIEQQLNRKSSEPEKPNHILLFTVLNPTYPITCEVLHTICSPVGGVQRIVIFKKNGVQAMVEFDSVDTAKQAKEALHGCDIYSGCCTLKIEFAKPTKLNVYKNDLDSWDYTNPNLGKTSVEPPAPPVSQRPVLLKEPLVNPAVTATGPQTVATPAALVNGSLHPHAAATLVRSTPDAAPFENGFAHHSPPQIAAAAAAAASVPTTCTNSLGLEVLNSARDPGIAARAATLAAAAGQSPIIRNGTPIIPGGATSPAPGIGGQSSATTGGSASGYQHQGSVCMVYGLCPDKMSASRIFNLFCLYGNVVRVKFLKTKEGCAMVQMGDGLAVERIVSNLNNSTFFGSKMQLGFSKQAFLADVQSPYTLPDGSPSFQDFMGSKNNRFINPEMASKNRIQPPSKILHFFNTPPGLEADDISDIFVQTGSPRPKCVKMFPSKTERSSSGLIEFESLSDSLEGIVVCNHHPIPNPNGKFPYIMKLCFSSSRSIPATIR